MSAIEYGIHENVALITMKSGENRFNPEFLEAFLKTLNRIERKTDAKTLVVTSEHEKIFSNGIDLEWLVPVLQQGDIKTAQAFFYLLNDLFKRILTYPMNTIAAINGHAFAGGAIFCCAFDFRFMRSDRGFFCFPEVDLGIPFLPGMNAILKKTIPRYKLEEMQFTGSRLTAYECQEHHIITKACQLATLMHDVMDFAKPLNKERSIMKELKGRLNNEIVQIIETEDPAYIESGNFNIK